MRFEEEIVAEELPWLQFTLKDQVYAINIGKITSILQMPKNITHVPEFPSYMRGMLDMRGDLIPVVDMRLFFGMPTIHQEEAEFSDMLEARKHDHVVWTDELGRSLAENRPFALATDPKKCAFGKWYYSFNSSNPSISFHLGKIEAPHNALHASAVELENCREHYSGLELEKRIEEIMGRLRGEYVPALLALLDETKRIFSSHYREMCVVLKDETAAVGLIVDHVTEVGDLTMIRPPNEAGLSAGPAVSKLVTGVGKAGGKDVLVLQDDLLFNSLAHVALAELK